MQQDSQQPKNPAPAPALLLLFVGFIIGVCVGFVTKDMVVRAMIKVVPPMSGTTDSEPLPTPTIKPKDPTTETPEVPTPEVPAVEVPAVTPAPTGEGTPEEPKPEEEKPAEEIAPAEAAAPAEAPPTL